MKSYRIASLLQGLAYMFVVLDLYLYPPGHISRVVINGHDVEVPSHTTFFQLIVGGTWLWVILFTIGALWLVGASILKPVWVVGGHVLLMCATAAFAAGYIASSWHLGVGWLGGGFALCLCFGHVLAVRAHPNTMALDGNDYRDVI